MSDRASRWAGLGVALWLVAALLVSLGSIRDPDLGFHIAWGRLLGDHFRAAGSLTLGQDPAVRVYAYSYWLYQRVVAGLHDHVGDWSLIALRASVVLASLALALDAARRLGARAWSRGVVLAFGVLIMHERFVDRPDVASHLLWMAALWILLFHRGGRGVWVLLPLQALWANLHVYFGLLPMLFVLFVVGDALEGRFAARRSALIVGGLLVASWLNPAGPGGWASQWALTRFASGHGLAMPIQEMLSPYAPQPQWTSTWVFRFAMPALVTVAITGRRRIGAGALLALAMTAALGALAQRAISLFGLTALAVVPAALEDLVMRLPPPVSRTLRASLAGSCAILGVVAVIGLANGRILLWQDKDMRIPDFAPLRFPATDASRFLRAENVQGPIFHNPISAGAILMENGTRLTPFLDPRWMPTPSAGVAYRRIVGARDQDIATIWSEVQRADSFQVVMLDFYEMPALLHLMAADPAWPLVYFDDGAAVFCRRGGPNQAVIARNEPRIAARWAFPDTARDAALGRAVLRFLASRPPSPFARLDFPWASFRHANFALQVGSCPEAEASYLELFRSEAGSLQVSRHRDDILGNVLACLAGSPAPDAIAAAAALTRRVAR